MAGLRDEEHRRGGRFGLVGVMSNLGWVLDLSHCGALVAKRRLKRAPSTATFPFTINHKEISVTVDARLVRKHKVKRLGTVLGLELMDVSEQQRQDIKEIIMQCRHWNVLPSQQDAA